MADIKTFLKMTINTRSAVVAGCVLFMATGAGMSSDRIADNGCGTSIRSCDVVKQIRVQSDSLSKEMLKQMKIHDDSLRNVIIDGKSLIAKMSDCMYDRVYK